MPLSLRDDDREMEILMAKAEWGVKRTCSSCRARFYDLAREPVVCPKCGAELDISAPVKPKRIKPGASGKTAPVAAAVTADTDLIDDEDELEEDIDDDDLDEAIDDDDEVVLDDDEDDDDGEIDVAVTKGADDENGADIEDFEGEVILEDDDDDEFEDDDDDGGEDDLKA